MIPYLDVSEVEVVERVASLGGRLHNETEAAIQFDHGYQIFSWHGVTVDQAVIESPETISLEEVKFEQNLEVRRVKIERFGLQRYIIESGAAIVNESEYGVLYRQRLAETRYLFSSIKIMSVAWSSITKIICLYS